MNYEHKNGMVGGSWPFVKNFVPGEDGGIRTHSKRQDFLRPYHPGEGGIGVSDNVQHFMIFFVFFYGLP